MILQKILLPNKEICDKKPLYLREINGAKYDLEKGIFSFKIHSRCKFDTYYNSFSLTKWKRYTTLKTLFLHLKVKGDFVVQVYQTIIEPKQETKVLFTDHFVDEVDLPISVDKSHGIISFSLECVSKSGRFISGYFYTEDEPLYDVKICMAVCTFRREEYIIKNLRQIEKHILRNKNSQLKEHLDVVVSDNGCTLPRTGFNKHIKIVENKNTGGAGGFTRGMMEMLDVQDEKQYSHILLTDDDIVLDPAVLERLYAILLYLKPAFREAFIGGSMFRTDSMVTQNELANRWERNNVIPLKHNIKLDSFAAVCANEKLDKINYFSWWFCCMPAGVVSRVNLPLPLFIKRDDIEYGLRNGSVFITINGINVWHEPFEGKRPAYLEYYYIRNQLIMESAQGKQMSKKALLKKTFKRLLDDVAKFHYLEFKYYCEGILDYCKGIDYFKSIDAVQLNNDLRAKDRKFYPLEELPIKFNEKQYKDSFIYREKRSRLIFRRLTLNGWLLPAKKKPAIVQSAFPKKLPFYRVSSALNVERISKRGYISHKSWKELFACHKLYKKVVKTIKKYYTYANIEFANRWHELISYDFWKDYLFNEPQPAKKSLPEIVKIDPNLRFKKQTKYVNYIKKCKVKSNVVYLESRKGTDFASNIYAIAKELKKDAYKNYKVYLGYMPENKELIQKKVKENKLFNVKLVEKESFAFLKIMATAKYFFTDFHLFPQFTKREGQVVVSLWHGTPLKTLGKDCKSETQASVQRIFYLADYQVYPGKFMEEKMLDVYWLKDIYQGKILETGYPRNGLLFDEVRRNEIRKQLHLEDKQVIMYMPTFRGSAGDNKNDEQVQRIAKYFEELDQKLTDNQIFYIKLHNYNTSSIDCSKYKHIVEAPTKFDNYELQSACDVMVTDYSSVFFDYAVTRRKIILFQYDQEDYLTNRGICMPLDELPFPIVKDTDGLINEINSPINYSDKAFLKKFATFDNIDASHKLCSHVILGEPLDNPRSEKHLKKSKKPNVFIYCGSLRTRQASLSFWDHVNKLDFSKANYFVLYYDPVMWKNAYRLNPMDDQLSQIGMWSYTSYTEKEKVLHDKYFQRDFSAKTVNALKEMYKRELVKHFGGQVHCDAVVLWNCQDPNVCNLYDSFAEYKFQVLPNKTVIKNPVLKHSMKNYKTIWYSKFNEFMDNFDFKKRKKK